MQARSAVQCRSARVSEAVSPAKSARVAIGLIVVKSVAKSLLILINRGDMGLRTPYTKNGSSARQSWGARAPRALAIAPSRSRTFEFPFQQSIRHCTNGACGDASDIDGQIETSNGADAT